jgi:mannose/cellobiose epimerase-like protein (N-acyl-D-glucosamine 2-epimerase family)
MAEPDAVPPEHLTWLADQRRGLRAFARGAVHPAGGFGRLDDDGRLVPGSGPELWITARMTHVAGLAVLEGDHAYRDVLDHGVAALLPGGVLHDDEYDGWLAAADTDGTPALTDKQAYGHAFVVLAAATASAARHPEADALLDSALDVLDRWFWRDTDGRVVDVWDRRWEELEAYRGANANMHTVEALLAAWDVTRDPRWLGHARSIVEHLVHGAARDSSFRLPEHFTPDWTPRPDHNRDHPADPFRPYGVTTGHLFEWSRLALNLRHALQRAAPSWLLDDARSLFDVAVHEGWSADGHEGFVYTTDFEGRPVVRDRLHWVVTEAIASARTLRLATGDPTYSTWYTTWWAHARDHFVDTERGSWHHELAPDLTPSASVWSGKPDVYHAYQVCLAGALPEVTSFAGALRDGLLPTDPSRAG